MRINFDYWANNVMENNPATLEYLISKLKDENLGFIKERPAQEGEHVLKYFNGKVVVRGRVPEGVAYKMTIQPKGILRRTVEGNYKTLKNIIESSGIKLIDIKQ